MHYKLFTYRLTWFLDFLGVKAALLSARLSHRNTVRLSVRLTQGWIRKNGAS